MVYKLGIILMIFSFISCSSSEDEIDTIYGTWELTSYTLENEYDFNNDGIASNNVLSEIDCFSDLTFTLNNDSTVFYPESNSTVTMSYLADGGYNVACHQSNSATFDWTLEGAEFRIIYSSSSGRLGNYSDSKITFISPASFLQVNDENETVVFTKQ